jgi:transposase
MLHHLGSSLRFPTKEWTVPAIPPYIIEPIWEQLVALLPQTETSHPLGCHRPRIPDRIVFEKLVQVLVFGCAYEKIADRSCSATTLRRRRDEWIAAGVIDSLRKMALEAYASYGRLGALGVGGGQLHNQGPMRRGEGGQEPGGPREAGHQALGGRGREGHTARVRVSAPANRHDSPLLAPTLDAARALGLVAEDASVHLDRGYDSEATRARLLEREFVAEISLKGRPAPLNATKRWVVERTNSWHNAHKKLVWCTERRGRVVDFWMALSEVVIIVRRLVREGWTRYRWEGRPSRRP